MSKCKTYSFKCDFSLRQLLELFFLGITRLVPFGLRPLVAPNPEWQPFRWWNKSRDTNRNVHRYLHGKSEIGSLRIIFAMLSQCQVWVKHFRFCHVPKAKKLIYDCIISMNFSSNLNALFFLKVYDNAKGTKKYSNMTLFFRFPQSIEYYEMWPTKLESIEIKLTLIQSEEFALK